VLEQAVTQRLEAQSYWWAARQHVETPNEVRLHLTATFLVSVSRTLATLRVLNLALLW